MDDLSEHAPDVRGGSPVRLVVVADLSERPRETVDLIARVGVELDDGGRRPLFERGLSSSALWSEVDAEEMRETALALTDPDQADEAVPAGLRHLPWSSELTPRLREHLAAARESAPELLRVLGMPPSALGTAAPADALGAGAALALRRVLSADLPGPLRGDPDVWTTPGVITAPVEEDPELLRVRVLHHAAVAVGAPVVLGRLGGVTVADLLSPDALGDRLDRSVEDVSAGWVLTADLGALSFESDPGPERAARQDDLLRVLAERPVVVERVPRANRAALSEAVSLGLRRVGVEVLWRLTPR